MELTIGVDPGTERHAFAVSGPGVTEVGFCSPNGVFPLRQDTRYVIEMPRRVHDTSTDGDIIMLARAAERFAARNEARSEWQKRGYTLSKPKLTVDFVSPDDWKMTRKKPHVHLSVWETLLPCERQVIATFAKTHKLRPNTVDGIAQKINTACERLAKTGKVSGYSWSLHNILDAVGIALWATGRIDKKGNLII